MAFYTDGVVPWNSLDNNTRAPLSSELEGGYPCGEADQELFNWTAGWPIGNIWNVLLQAGLTPDVDKLLDLARAIQSQKLNYVVAAGSANTITGDFSPVLASADYRAGLVLNLLVATTNTGAVTFNGKAVVNNNGGALIGGELVAGNIASMIYDGARFRLVGTSRGRLLNTQVFQTPGTSTYTPTPGTQYVEVEVVGGGGAAGGSPATNASQNSAAGSGGSGAYARKLIASGFSGVTVTVGATGGGVSGGTGGNGGASSFGSHVAANGGQGGQTAGPTSTSNNFYAAGGAAGVAGSSGNLNFSGISGVGVLVIGSQGTNPTETPSVFAGGAGSGGPGNSSPPSAAVKTGQSGQPGIVIVREYA